MERTKVIYSSSFLAFLRKKRFESKVARLLYAHYENSISNDRYFQQAYELIVTLSEVNYITFRTDGSISYLPNGKEHKQSVSGDWSRDNRQHGKAAKIIRKLFTKNALRLFTDKDFEVFSNFYKSSFSDNGYKLELLPRNKIKSIYDANLEDGGGTLNGSCMNGDSSYLDIYSHCQQLSILALTNKDGLLAGRALVWKISDDVTLMDRIYTAQDWQYELFLNYARERKLWYKERYTTYDYKRDFVNSAGNLVSKTFTVHTDTDFDSYPYIDTFSYGGNGFLTNSNSGEYCFEYNNTDGSRSGDDENEDDGIWDEIDECTIDEDDAVQVDRGRYRGQYTHRDNVVEVHNNYWWKDDDDITYSSYYGEYYENDDLTYCEHDDEYYLNEDVVRCETDDEYYKDDDDDITKIGDDYYRKDDENVVKVGKEYLLKEDAIFCETDGKYYEDDDDDLVKIYGKYYRKDDENLENNNGWFSLKEIAYVHNPNQLELELV